MCGAPRNFVAALFREHLLSLSLSLRSGPLRAAPRDPQRGAALCARERIKGTACANGEGLGGEVVYDEDYFSTAHTLYDAAESESR